MRNRLVRILPDKRRAGVCAQIQDVIFRSTLSPPSGRFIHQRVSGHGELLKHPLVRRIGKSRCGALPVDSMRYPSTSAVKTVGP